MNILLSILFAVLFGAAGCWLSARLLPVGAPRTVGEVASVIMAFATCFGGLRWLR